MASQNKLDVFNSYDEIGDTEIHVAESQMNSGKPLSPKMISSLMNISLPMKNEYSGMSDDKRDFLATTLYTVALVVMALLIAVAGGFLLTYTTNTEMPTIGRL
jgi:hypothetical protein